MRIGIDARLLTQTGVGSYTRNLLIQLAPICRNTVELVVFIRKQDRDVFDRLETGLKPVYADYHWHSVSEQTLFLYMLLRQQLQLVHFTYFSHPTFYYRPFVITIHDLIPYSHATGKASTRSTLGYAIKHIAYRALIHRAARHSKAVIVPSHAVKDELTLTCGTDIAHKTHVTYEGISATLQAAKPRSTNPLGSTSKYFLYVGNCYPHKNIERLIEAYAHIDSSYNLVLIGPDDYFSRRIVKLVHHRNLQAKVHIKHDISDEDLATYYAHASALVHPSLIEGFGLPLIEAAYFGTPVIASNIPVYRELLKDQFMPFNPHSVTDMQRTLTAFIKAPQKIHLTRPFINAHYTFAKMARSTYDIYTQSLGS